MLRERTNKLGTTPKVNVCYPSLRTDHQLRQFTLKVPALAGDTDGERDLLIVIIFEQTEDMIDAAIAERRVATN